MKRLTAIALLLAVALVPAVSAQTNAFTGKWEGTFVPQRPDGTTGNPNPILLNLTQKADVVTGTAGPDAERQWNIEKGAVKAGKATFQVQQPNGPLYTFTLTVTKGRLQGDMHGELNGQTRDAKVDAAKAK